MTLDWQDIKDNVAVTREIRKLKELNSKLRVTNTWVNDRMAHRANVNRIADEWGDVPDLREFVLETSEGPLGDRMVLTSRRPRNIHDLVREARERSSR